MKAISKKIELYNTKSGKQPFIDWLESIKDKTMRYRIKERLDRIALGNMGDCKPIKCGVSALRFNFGPGYRVYYGEQNNTVIILLCGGNKSTQEKDIKKALSYWEDYLAR